MHAPRLLLVRFSDDSRALLIGLFALFLAVGLAPSPAGAQPDTTSFTITDVMIPVSDTTDPTAG